MGKAGGGLPLQAQEEAAILPQLNAPLSGSLISIPFQDEWSRLTASGQPGHPGERVHGEGAPGPFPPWCPSLQAVITSSLCPKLAGMGVLGEALPGLGLPSQCVCGGGSPFGGGELCTSPLLQQRSP